MRLVGMEHGVQFEYAGSDVYEAKGFEGLEKHNDSVHKILSKKSAFGSNWLDTLYQRVDSRLALHEKVRTLIREQEIYKSKAVFLVEPILLITKDKHQQKFDVHLIGQYTDKPEKGLFCISKFTLRISPLKVRIKTCTGSGHLVFPENGVGSISH